MASEREAVTQSSHCPAASPASKLPPSHSPLGPLSAFPSKSFRWTRHKGMPSAAEALKLLFGVGKKKSRIFPLILTMTQKELCQFTTDEF